MRNSFANQLPASRPFGIDNLDINARVTVRIATPQDIPEMIRLERQCSTAAHWTDQQYGSLWAAQERSTRLALIAERGMSAASGDLIPTLIGFLVARHLAPEWELENIVVAPDSRRSGIGTRLMEELLARAKQTNSDAVFLEVRESNAAAQAVYHKLDFKQIGCRKSYYANPIEDAILYSKPLRTNLTRP